MNLTGKLLNICFGIFFSCVIIIALGGAASAAGERVSMAPLLTGIMAAVALALSIGMSRLEKIFEKRFGSGTDEESEETYRKIFAVTVMILLAVQIITAVICDFEPINDLSYICKGAKNSIMLGADRLYEGLPERHQHYFAVYPNNHMLYCVIYILYRIEYFITGDISNILPIAVNIIGLNISYILMYRCAKLIYSPPKALVCAVSGLMFTPIFTYSPFFYTDSMSMPWLTGSLYLYLRWRRISESSGGRRKALVYLCACGAVLAIAYKLKGSAIIFIPAVTIDLLLRRKCSGGAVKKLAAKLFPVVILTAAFAVTCAAAGAVSRSTLKTDVGELEKYRFPLVHWVMMSADGDGGYNLEDFQYTKSYDGYNNKVSADLERLSDKLSSQGVSGFVSHLANKISYTWRDGSYMAGYYMKCSAFKSSAFYVITALLNFTLLFKILNGFLGKIKAADDALSESFVLKIMFVGITLFLLIWEARCRYLVSFFMLFALI